MNEKPLNMLVCAATGGELKACPFQSFRQSVTGVGIPQTLVQLERLYRSQAFSGILNLGIAGAYPSSELSIGDVVVVTGETFGDVGYEGPGEDGSVFHSIGSLGLDTPYERKLPLSAPEGLLSGDNAAFQVTSGAGCTVNCCTGTQATGLSREKRTGASIETMEGAAVALFGREHRLPVVEIRAISNMAAKRDMRPENIQLALRHLNAYLSHHQSRIESEDFLRRLALPQ